MDTQGKGRGKGQGKGRGKGRGKAHRTRERAKKRASPSSCIRKIMTQKIGAIVNVRIVHS